MAVPKAPEQSGMPEQGVVHCKYHQYQVCAAAGEKASFAVCWASGGGGLQMRTLAQQLRARASRAERARAGCWSAARSSCAWTGGAAPCAERRL